VQGELDRNVFLVKARRCKRCGGILTSEEGVRTGYGHTCAKKERAAEQDRKMREIQCSLFEDGGTDSHTSLRTGSE
jgi:ubiquitin